ncbi:LAMI_0A01684g1_1 [Lachancea mirantina]|uniref:LAMI_0A01684g1_1 n=1 Tax=Lachancea mirantina TaxID=1230905 RepID=A0A1G4ILW5_9SACH|nr:LAMI_0A01684g1_1 [Lachancea mirantina]
MSMFSKTFCVPSPLSSGPGPAEPLKPRKAMDDLLLPSLNMDSAMFRFKHNTPANFNAMHLSKLQKRAKTAPPASQVLNGVPHTPTSSPFLSQSNMCMKTMLPSLSSQVLAHSGAASVPRDRTVDAVAGYTSSASDSLSSSHFISSSWAGLNQPSNRNGFDSSSSEGSSRYFSDQEDGGPLPSLRHLRLLPNPCLQQYAPHYPDTSERTRLWRQNLLQWCKTENYNDFLHIEREVGEAPHLPRPGFGNLNVLANVASTAPLIPSVLNHQDQFYELSNTSLSQGVITPPISPPNNTQNGLSPLSYTPFMSEKLVQAIKRKRVGNHKKTNSFKARELKRLFANRDVLSINSEKKVTKPLKRHSAPSSPKQYVIKVHELCSPRPRTRSPSPVRLSPCANAGQNHVFHEPSTPVTNVESFKNTSSNSPPQKLEFSFAKKIVSPKRISHRTCISCHSSDSPCWRPSWTDRKQDQLCNSCGLRYKKTHARCLNANCRKIPSKGEMAIMKANGLVRHTQNDGTIVEGLSCLFCNNIVEIK